MGELITAKNLVAPVQVSALPGTPLQPQSTGFNINMSDIKEIIGLLNEGIKNFKSLQEMRAQLVSQPQSLEARGQNTNIVYRDEAIASHDKVVNVPVQQIKKTQKIDRLKLRDFLFDIFYNQAKKLPEDIKSKQINDVIGENLKTFRYKYKNALELDAEFIINTLTEQLSNNIDLMLKEE